jgi:hypothetical protein
MTHTLPPVALRGDERLRLAEELGIRSHVSKLGERTPASSSRYSLTVTPSLHAACPIDQPARFRSCSSTVGSIATARTVPGG